MSNRKKPHKNDVCEGCLAKERKLTPIKQYLRVYQKLMEDYLSEETLHKIITSQVPKMCIECRRLLRNAQKFQKRAKLAQDTLDERIHSYDDMTCTPQASIITKFKEVSPVRDITNDDLIVEQESENQNDIKNEREIKDEFENVVKVKDEKEFEDIKLEDYDDTEYIDDLYVEDMKEADNIHSQTIKEEESDKKLQRSLAAKKRSRTLTLRYRMIGDAKNKSKSFSKMRKIVEVDEEGRQSVLDKFRKREKYVNSRYKCESCVTGFFNKNRYEAHMKKYHLASNRYECDVCGVRMSTKGELSRHINEHKYKYVCMLCDYECFKKNQFYYHMGYTHHRAVECLKCGLHFQFKEFYNHYNSMHKNFICDYCGHKATSKKRLVGHIRIKHCENICKFCNRKYSKYHSMTRHIQLRHTKKATEECYCVECNIQFDNIKQYRYHLTTSVKHRPKKSYPCPECHKVYARLTGMKNHYKYIHLQKTSFYCEPCSRYFLNGFRLRTHTATFHNKIHPPKNKICSFCGRGFETNRILDNHIRTHTGERPFACEHCTATFAQKSALVSHTRSIHKILIRYANAV